MRSRSRSKQVRYGSGSSARTREPAAWEGVAPTASEASMSSSLATRGKVPATEAGNTSMAATEFLWARTTSSARKPSIVAAH